jgi:ADP-ribosylglycohydrolase
MMKSGVGTNVNAKAVSPAADTTQNRPRDEPQTPQNTDYCASYKRGGFSDRIAGMVFGHALGDAVGLISEFREFGKIEFPYTESIREVPPCDWTDDTDLLILTMGSLMENNMRFIVKDITGRFVYWINKGLIYTGATNPKTPNNTFKYIVSKKNWAENPAKVAGEVFTESKETLCNNSPITRIAIIGSLPDPITFAVNFCTLTHVDTRCIATCVFYGCVLNSLIYNHIHTVEKIDDYVANATSAALEHIAPKYVEEFKAHVASAMKAHVKTFKLAEMSCASNIYKSLQCICYGLHVVRTAVSVSKYPDFKKCIEVVTAEGGDADANGAVVGAIVGAYLGYSRLPRDWVYSMPYNGSLNQFVAIYISKLFAPTTMEENELAAEKNREKNKQLDANANTISQNITGNVAENNVRVESAETIATAENVESTETTSTTPSVRTEQTGLTMDDINSLVIDPDK